MTAYVSTLLQAVARTQMPRQDALLTAKGLEQLAKRPGLPPEYARECRHRAAQLRREAGGVNHEWYQTEDGERIWLAKSDYTYREALREAAGPARDCMGSDESYYYRYVGLVDATLTEHEAGCCCAVDLPEDDPDAGMTCRTERVEPAWEFELDERKGRR